jgi:uncharacterized repeat protein (TIGR01451 family)
MKFIERLLLAACALFSFNHTNAQLTQVYNEVYAVDGVPGYTTYRIFAELDNSGDFLSSVFAAEYHDLLLGGSGGVIWNSSAGATTGDALATGFCGFVPDICYDSFVTIGWYGPNDFNDDPIGCGQATTTISSIPNASVIPQSFGTNENAPNLVAQDAAWFTTNLSGCNDNGFGIGPTNKVFIAQVTIPSSDNLIYNLNIQVFPNGDGNDPAIFVHDPTDLGVNQFDGSTIGLIWPYGNCLDLAACNYNSFPELDEYALQCDYSCYGCMDSAFCNFDPEATFDDGSCSTICPGCIDTTASNFDENASEDDGSCEYIGCMDALAANYDPFATVDNGSCQYPGCIAQLAANYDPNANLDDGSCLFHIYGHVFYDGNQSGIFENLDFEYGLAFQEVTLEPGGLSVITDEDGYFSFGDQPVGTYTLNTEANASFPINTTPLSYTITPFDLLNTVFHNFGMTDDQVYHELWLEYYPWAIEYPCNGQQVYHQIYYRNMGSEPVSGIVQFAYDILFAGYTSSSNIDSIVGNTIFMSYENLLPGQMGNKFVKLITPDFPAMGEFLTTTAYVNALEGEEILAEADETLEIEVTCAWDPNDKMVFPGGYEEPHYVLGDQELEYVIRFQNTGNAFAETVLLRDTIAEELDLNSFALMANSHNVLTTIDSETREVQFLFENIMLPDSGFSEPDSHGLVSYLIKPIEDLPAETQFTNTAYIYFDLNPPIVTNTTWNTIYECGSEGSFTVNDDAFCLGSELIAQSTHPYVEQFLWELDDMVVSEEATFEETIEEAGVYELAFTGSNPLCSSIETIAITVSDIPDAIIADKGAVLTASDGDAWQWYLDGNEIEGATDQFFIIEDMGVYTVEVFLDAGCSAISEGVTITSIHDLATQMAVLFPNPMTSSSTLVLGEGTYSVTITDAAGRIVRAYENINGGTHTLERDGLASGVYQMHIATKDQPLVQSMQLVVQ